MTTTQKKYHVLMHSEAYQMASDYWHAIQVSTIKPGQYLQDQLQGTDVEQISPVGCGEERTASFAIDAVHAVHRIPTGVGKTRSRSMQIQPV